MLSIVSTVGTTVFGGFNTPLSKAVKDLENTKPSNLHKIASEKNFPGDDIYQQALADLKAKQGNFLREACAEINAIEGFHAEPGRVARGNHYHFLASDTLAGLLAARILQDFCLERYEASHAEVHLIHGLQVADGQKFRLQGLPRLIEEVYKIFRIAKEKNLRVILNPTGGFKAAIPYLTLIGMIQQAEVGLIHETSKNLITLKGLPIILDIPEIKKIKKLLDKFEEKEAQQEGVQKKDILDGLGLNHRHQIEDHRLWSLFEHYEDDRYILSGLGSIALEEIKSLSKNQTVWLSQQAYRRLEKDFPKGTQARENFETILNRLQNPDMRTPPYRHEYQGSEFPAYKYKGNERLFYHEHPDGYILVLELAQHNSDNDWAYDRTPTKIEDYKKFERWEPATD